jgi:hypothetical protein
MYYRDMKTFVLITWDQNSNLIDIVSINGKRKPLMVKKTEAARLQKGLRAAVYDIPAELCTVNTGFGFDLIPMGG